LKKTGVTALFVTHDMPTAIRVCDRFCLLGGGRVAAERTAEQLTKDHSGPLHDFMAGEGGG
jgi:ABC-type transporter Mla maintaining outer membrane lipid asymmetry ATPase subunit MlaF